MVLKYSITTWTTLLKIKGFGINIVNVLILSFSLYEFEIRPT